MSEPISLRYPPRKIRKNFMYVNISCSTVLKDPIFVTLFLSPGLISDIMNDFFFRNCLLDNNMESALNVMTDIMKDDFLDTLLTVIYWFVGMSCPNPTWPALTWPDLTRYHERWFPRHAIKSHLLFCWYILPCPCVPTQSDLTWLDSTNFHIITVLCQKIM